MSAILILGYDENVCFEKGADGLTAYGVDLDCRRDLVAKDWIEVGVVGGAEQLRFSLHKVGVGMGFRSRAFRGGKMIVPE